MDLFLNSSIAASVPCEILAAKLQGGGGHVESVLRIQHFLNDAPKDGIWVWRIYAQIFWWDG